MANRPAFLIPRCPAILLDNREDGPPPNGWPSTV
jgi:hypothetical protein